MAIYKATFIASAMGQDIRNTLHVQHNGTATPNELAGSLRTAWQSAFLGALSSAYQFQGVEVENIADDSAIGFAPVTGSGTGGDEAPPLPAWACVSIRWNSERRGRAGTGKLGLGPITELKSDGNSLTTGTAAAYATMANTFRTDIQSSGGAAAMSLVVVSKIKDGVERPTPLVSLVTSASANSVLGSRLSRHPNR